MSNQDIKFQEDAKRILEDAFNKTPEELEKHRSECMKRIYDDNFRNSWWGLNEERLLSEDQRTKLLMEAEVYLKVMLWKKNYLSYIASQTGAGSPNYRIPDRVNAFDMNSIEVTSRGGGKIQIPVPDKIKQQEIAHLKSSAMRTEVQKARESRKKGNRYMAGGATLAIVAAFTVLGVVATVLSGGIIPAALVTLAIVFGNTGSLIGAGLFGYGAYKRYKGTQQFQSTYSKTHQTVRSQDQSPDQKETSEVQRKTSVEGMKARSVSDLREESERQQRQPTSEAASPMYRTGVEETLRSNIKGDQKFEKEFIDSFKKTLEKRIVEKQMPACNVASDKDNRVTFSGEGMFDGAKLFADQRSEKESVALPLLSFDINVKQGDSKVAIEALEMALSKGLKIQSVSYSEDGQRKQLDPTLIKEKTEEWAKKAAIEITVSESKKDTRPT